jgi:hypothetical protein
VRREVGQVGLAIQVGSAAQVSQAVQRMLSL